MKQSLVSKKLRAVGKALFFIGSAFNKVAQHHTSIYENREFRKSIITIVDRFSPAIPRKKLYDWIGINPQQFYAWRRRSCKASMMDLCRLRHVNQLTFHEVITIKNYLNYYLHSLHTKVAVYGKMVRDGAAYMSPKSFYNYSRLLGYKNRRIPKRKQNTGLRAVRPKQILHMDVTVYKFQDNTKAYIYLIQDNFSRHILNWKISRTCNSTFACQNLKEACDKYNLLDEESIDLIVDGGMENKGEVLKFLKTQTTIKLKTALKDVPQSNSMIEKLNMQLKYYHWFPRDITTYNEMIEVLPKTIEDKCQNIYRPDLGFRSTHETFHGIYIGIRTIENNYKTAARNRKSHNKQFQCERHCYN